MVLSFQTLQRLIDSPNKSLNYQSKYMWNPQNGVKHFYYHSPRCLFAQTDPNLDCTWETCFSRLSPSFLFFLSAPTQRSLAPCLVRATQLNHCDHFPYSSLVGSCERKFSLSCDDCHMPARVKSSPGSSCHSLWPLTSLTLLYTYCFCSCLAVSHRSPIHPNTLACYPDWSTG